MRRPLPRQAPGQRFAIQAVQPMEMLGDDAGLVALQGADEVPFQGQVGQGFDLGQGFLRVTFAEQPLPGGMRLPDRLGGKSLAHRQKAGTIRASTRGGAGDFDAGSASLQGGGDCAHNAPRSLGKNHVTRGIIMEISELLAFSVKNKASDLHLSAGLPPMIRVHGDIRRINVPPLNNQEVRAMIYDIMSDAQRKGYEEHLELDFSFELRDVARFRVNAFNQERGAGAVFRTIPSLVLTLEQLEAPKIFKEIADTPRGIVVVTGPTGSGKSTTLAAMVDYVNENQYGHILTIEDPIEFVHKSKRCLVNQREVGPHTHGFAEALRSALREDPDVILVGEMRDLETIRLALTAAETGHLVFGTLHTSSAAKTIDRIIDVFPAAEKEMVRAMLSESLRSVISQTLLKRKDGSGRVAVHEIMLGTPAIRNLIREAKVAQMYSSIQTGQSLGMQTLDQALVEMVRRNVIDTNDARAVAVNKDMFL
jgi:twitching motility protein PilT